MRTQMRVAWGLLPALALASMGHAQQRRCSPTPFGLDEYYPVPADNPLTPAGVALGRRLFFDPVLSRDSTVACASCHLPDRAFSDSVVFSRGVAGQRTTRNAPSILNRTYGNALFWDGRAATLEEAVVEPIENPREMALSLRRLVRRLAGDSAYGAAFARAFGDGVSERTVARALASYVRTLRSGNAPADRYLAGDTAALSPEARRGLRVFAGRGNCIACHVGATFTDERFHNTGVAWGGGDPGRFAVTGDSADLGAFKTPSLRNVAVTAPYMHDGSLATLDDVIAFYDGGGTANPRLDPEIRPLGFSAEERRALRAFLEALTGEKDGRDGSRNTSPALGGAAAPDLRSGSAALSPVRRRDARPRGHYPTARDRPDPCPPAPPCAPRPPRARATSAQAACAPAPGSWVRLWILGSGVFGLHADWLGTRSGRIPTPHALAAAPSAPGFGRQHRRAPAPARRPLQPRWTVHPPSRTVGGPIEIPIRPP